MNRAGSTVFNGSVKISSVHMMASNMAICECCSAGIYSVNINLNPARCRCIFSKRGQTIRRRSVVKYLLYVLRWVVLAIPGALFFNKVKQVFGIEDVYLAMVISQAMMGAMVYFVDRMIFSSGRVPIPWEVRHRAVCADCGKVGRCYRVAGNKCCEAQDAPGVSAFRCEDCAVKRIQ
jgi:hypothetical protein